MLKERHEDRRLQLEVTCTDMLVSEEHLLRKIEKAVNFKHIYDIVGDLYCSYNGRPGVDPVVLFKMVLIQHLYGIRSLRQTHAEITMNIAFRWFLGYGISETIPHFATVSYNFRHRFTEETVDQIFEWILSEIEAAGYLAPEVVYVDGTHIKGNANIHKAVKQAIPVAARTYERQLMEEINKDRDEHGKTPFNGSKGDGKEEKEVTVSTADPESGIFHKGEHKRCFAYCTQTACDDHGYILSATVNPGNVHDSVAFDGIYRQLKDRFSEMEVIAADAGYKTPWICKELIDDGILPVMPYVRPKTKEGFFFASEYVYDEYYDCILCPENQVLKYSTTNREGYREYKSKPVICSQCPSRNRCTESRNQTKVVSRHIWSNYVEQAEDIRHTPKGKSIYKRRKETIERVFADAKEKYGMRYTLYRGLCAVRKWVKLKYAAMNLKKLAIHKWYEQYGPDGSPFSSFFTSFRTLITVSFECTLNFAFCISIPLYEKNPI